MWERRVEAGGLFYPQAGAGGRWVSLLSRSLGGRGRAPRVNPVREKALSWQPKEMPPKCHLHPQVPSTLAWPQPPPTLQSTARPPGALRSPLAQWPPVPRLRNRGGATPPPPRWPPASGSFWQIYYWEADSQNGTEKMRVLFLPETTAKLKNLTSHTPYLVSISAFNAAGDGPRSDPRQGRTHQAGRRTMCFLSAAWVTPLPCSCSPTRPLHSLGAPLCLSCEPDPA